MINVNFAIWFTHYFSVQPWDTVICREITEQKTFFLVWRRKFLYLLTYLITSLLTYSMEQSPSWEANWFAASQEIPCTLWNMKVHYCIHKCPPPVPILSQLDPVHTTPHFLKIHLNIILPSAPASPHWSLSLQFPHQIPVHGSPLPHMRHRPHQSHSSWFYHSHNIGWAVQIIKFLIM